eukprot:TRINITY_DN9773_c0_g1_i8.p1 TRINITY_DN9773_c0_g1~~TRINITY_DN9773_c0_g1_i8.p1  ORF type:complete len:347 (-),score=61.31 TRINITY_DN9773_c0_g1_i8:82-1122(-)
MHRIYIFPLFCILVNGYGPPVKRERFLWELIGSMFSTPVADTPIMVVVDTVDKQHKTRVIDLSGGECSVNLPSIGDQVLLESASFEQVQNILVLCNLYPENGSAHYRSNYYCAGARTGSRSWVKLPPKYEFLTTRRESTVVDNSLVIVGHVVQKFKINQESVFTGDIQINTPKGDLGGCTVYDEPNDRVLHISAGEVKEIDPSFVAPYKVINTKFINRWMTGCSIVIIDGKRSLVVAGGYPASPSDEWLEFASTVEYIHMENLVGNANKSPKVLPATTLLHNNQPAVTQVGEDIILIGGGQVNNVNTSCAERWNGREWLVMDLDCNEIGINGSPLVTFVNSDFCHQ